jgi:hypothetical protein
MQVASAAVAHRSTSLYAVAFLLAHDLPLIDVVRDQGGRAEFLIGGDAATAASLLRDYKSGTAVVNARRFGDELRRVKGLLYGHE